MIYSVTDGLEDGGRWNRAFASEVTDTMFDSMLGTGIRQFMLRGSAALIAILLAAAGQAATAHSHSVHHVAKATLSAPASSTQTFSPDQSGAPSDAVTTLLRWVTASGDNKGLPFIIIDKLGARIFVFDGQAQLMGTAPALIGIARGDDAAPGVGTLRLGKIPVEQRTTPAGRFIARFGPAKGHPPVLWVDYGDAISLHPVVTANKKERRLQRIKSADADDHRISFGCINVPASFYGKTIRPQFKSRNSSAVVYILPDTKPLTDVFPGIVLQASAPSGAERETAAGTYR